MSTAGEKRMKILFVVYVMIQYKITQCLLIIW
ncbi:hypothetical protein [Escherichia phage FL12]